MLATIPPELQTELQAPTLADVYKARRVVSRHLKPSPLLRSSHLSRLTGADIYVKCESLLPTGAFKIRGGLNLVSQLTPDERQRGVITASTGNHGQSIGYAAREYGVRAIIGVPLNSNPYKLQAMRDLGAEVVEMGQDFDEARQWVAEEAQRHGYRYIHSGNEPLLIAGVATGSLELVEEVPDLDFIFVPIGGGSGASGHCIAAKGINPRIQVIGVQSELAPAFYQSWQSGQYSTTPSCPTFAEGIATRIPFALPFNILSRLLDDVTLVSEEELRQAIRLYMENMHLVAEGASAAPLAAALKAGDRIAGKKVALVLSGGNIAYSTLKEILAGG